MGRLRGEVNHNCLRVVVADGDLLLNPTVARRSGGIACGSSCGRCRRGTCNRSIRTTLSATLPTILAPLPVVPVTSPTSHVASPLARPYHTSYAPIPLLAMPLVHLRAWGIGLNAQARAISGGV